MRDENDILFNQYSLDFFGFIDFLFRTLSGGGSGGGTGGGFVTGFSPSSIAVWLSDIWSVLVVLSWMASALLVFGIIYAYIRHEQLGEVIGEILKRQEDAFRQIHSGQVKNARWQDVLEHSASEQPNDWKLAIIEADIILEELLSELGYAGVSVGDKLKSAPSSFRTIDQAWRAHNVRNRIAHEGANFELSEVMARETIAQYKMVFDEFDFV